MISKKNRSRLKVGIVGCGAIGSGIALSITNDLKKHCQVSGLYDINEKKAEKLAKKILKKARPSLNNLIKSCDCMVEAVNADNTKQIIQEALKAKKSVLAMSVGKLLDAQNLFNLAKRNNCQILIPSGAIAGIDAIKAASLTKIKSITLTTRKNPAGLTNSPYFTKYNIDPSKIKKETEIFKGNVASAVKYFPQNINVAATIALAAECKDKLTIRIICSPHFKRNSHEIKMIGDFGTMVTQTENLVCPDNPKTSYLAVLSGIQTLKQYCTGIFVGT